MRLLWIHGPKDQGKGEYTLMSDDGFGLATLECENPWQARDDLLDRNTERKERWSEYLSDGYNLRIADEEKRFELQSLNALNFDTEQKNKAYIREEMKLLPIEILETNPPPVEYIEIADEVERQHIADEANVDYEFQKMLHEQDEDELMQQRDDEANAQAEAQAQYEAECQGQHEMEMQAQAEAEAEAHDEAQAQYEAQAHSE